MITLSTALSTIESSTSCTITFVKENGKQVTLTDCRLTSSYHGGRITVQLPNGQHRSIVGITITKLNNDEVGI